MSHFRTALVLSVGLHLTAFLGGVLNHPAASRNVSETKDFHLPVSVELVRLNESAAPIQRSSLPSAVKPSRALIPQTAPKVPEQIVLKKSTMMNRFESPLKPLTQEFRAITKTALKSKKAWNRPPVYPDYSRRMKQEGRVILEASLDDSGKVIGVRVVRSSGFVPLDQSAMDAVREWKMDLPANGSRRLFIPVTFELKSSA